MLCVDSSCVIATCYSDADSIINREINEVEIKAFRQREVIPPQRLTGRELEGLNAHSVADVVRYFSGVQIKDYGGVGGMKTVDIRSMGSNHVGVFYDGVELSTQNGTPDLGRFSLDIMEEVSVYNGQKAEVFQPAKDFGKSGSIYLKTRRPVFRDKGDNIRVIFRTGSSGLANPSVLYEHQINQNVSISANAEYTHANGKYKFRYHKVLEDTEGNIVTAWDTTGIRQNGAIDSERIELGLFGNINAGQWQAKAYFYNSERGIPKAIVRNVWTSSQKLWDRDLFLHGLFHKNFSHLFSTKENAKYSRNHMRYLNPDTTLLYVDNSFTQHSIYFSSANMWHVYNFIDADVSVDYEHNWMASDMVNFANPVRNIFLTAWAISIHPSRFKSQLSLLSNVIGDKTTTYSAQSGDFKRTTKKLTPALFLSYRLCDSQSKEIDLRAFYKRMFRMPTFNDLYYTDLGNISLKPEYATQYNIGFNANNDVSWTVCRLSVDIYHNEITDKIIAVPKGNSQYRWMMMNIGKVNIDGADVNISLEKNTPALFDYRLNINYTYQKALDMTDPSDNGAKGTYKGQISYIPRHSGSVIAQAGISSWNACYSFIYVGERYHVSANIPQNYEPAWYTHDMELTKHIDIQKGRVGLDISAEINNMFDQQYDVVLNYPMPGRNYKLILRLTL